MVNAQANLNIRWVLMTDGTFSDVEGHLFLGPRCNVLAGNLTDQCKHLFCYYLL